MCVFVLLGRSNTISFNNNWICYMFWFCNSYFAFAHVRPSMMNNEDHKYGWNGKRNCVPKWENPNCHSAFSQAFHLEQSSRARFVHWKCLRLQSVLGVSSIQRCWLMIHFRTRSMEAPRRTIPHLFRTSYAQTADCTLNSCCIQSIRSRSVTIIMRRIMAYFSSDNTESKHNQNKSSQP